MIVFLTLVPFILEAATTLASKMHKTLLTDTTDALHATHLIVQASYDIH